VCLARDPLVAPLGFTLLGSPARALAGFRPTSSHALEPFGPAPRSINRPLPEPVRFLRQAAEGEQATPFRVSHHAGSQPFEPATSELLVHFAQPEHITVPRLHSLNAVKALPELLGSASGAEHRDLTTLRSALVRPSEPSDLLLEPKRLRLDSSSRLAARPEYSQTQVPPLLVRRSHFAVGHSLGCVVFPEPATLGYG
jgi:hypothetical protein